MTRVGESVSDENVMMSPASGGGQKKPDPLDPVYGDFHFRENRQIFWDSRQFFAVVRKTAKIFALRKILVD